MGVSKNIGSLVIRLCTHFFTLLEDPVMVRTIKPQRAQRITESCYFSLLPPLCPSVSLCGFLNQISKISKSLRGFETLPREISKSQNIPANERSMAGFALVPLLTAGLVIRLREKSIGKGILSAGGVVTTPESLFTAEGKGKETRVEPANLEYITMIGQLTITEGVASNATVPNDRVISREGKCIPQYRHRRLIGADIHTESDSRSNIYHRRYVSQNRYEAVVDGWHRSGRGIESGSGFSDWGNITALIDRSN